MRRYASVLHSCTCCIFLAFFRRINVFIIEYYSRGTPANLSPSPWYSRNSCPHSRAFSVESAGFPPYRLHCRHLRKSRKDDCLMCSVCLCTILVDLTAKVLGLTTVSSQMYRLLFFCQFCRYFGGFFGSALTVTLVRSAVYESSYLLSAVNYADYSSAV